jgi:hypothetical protein
MRWTEDQPQDLQPHQAFPMHTLREPSFCLALTDSQWSASCKAWDGHLLKRCASPVW